MSDTIKLPVIAGVEITKDDQGRFNLNALHKASELGESKEPNKWLALKGTCELIKELEATEGSCGSLICKQKGGISPGTFAHELLAISYAGWVSPKFQLQVNQTFLDYKKGNQPPAQQDLSRMDILQMAIESEKEKLALKHEVETLKPKADFCDKVSVAEDAISIGQAAKLIGTGRNRLLSVLRKHKWVTRINEPYQAKIENGLMDVKIGQWEHPNQGLQRSVTALVTGKGLIELQRIYGESA